MGDPAVLCVGHIDREVYRCVTDDIVTDEVIITEERIAHIQEHHPGDYETYLHYITEIIEAPDYILEANRPNTAFLLKRFDDVGERFEMIVRIRVSTDPEEYRNSVITFLRIKNKKWQKYLRNKKILYRAE